MIAIVLMLVALALSACEKPPSADSLREWTPADHHSTDDDKLASAAQQAPAQRPSRGAGAGPAQAGASARDGSRAGTSAPNGAAAVSDAAPLVELTWRQQCSTCHGPFGKGDGQMSAMFRVPDLSQESWQSTVSDADIAAIIKNGKGKMPNFDVPDDVIRGLVARVRAVRGR